MVLSEIVPGASATIRGLQLNGDMRRRLLDIGLVEGTQIQCIQRSPLGDPTAFLIRGAVIALREEDAQYVLVE